MRTKGLKTTNEERKGYLAMQLGKWATWGEVTFNPDLEQFAIISVMLKELAS